MLYLIVAYCIQISIFQRSTMSLVSSNYTKNQLLLSGRQHISRKSLVSPSQHTTQQTWRFNSATALGTKKKTLTKIVMTKSPFSKVPLFLLHIFVKQQAVLAMLIVRPFTRQNIFLTGAACSLSIGSPFVGPCHLLWSLGQLLRCRVPPPFNRWLDYLDNRESISIRTQ